MALSDFVPAGLRTKPVGGHGDAKAPRVSGVSDDAITPVVEHEAGHVLPYRGTELHGVDVPETHYADPRGELRSAVDVELVKEPHPVTPVLVKVVKNDGDEYTDWRVISTLAGTVPIALLNRNRNRICARIINNGAATVLLGRDAMMNVNNSYPLAAGASFLDIRHSEDVWVMSQDGSSVDVRAVFEFKRG